VITGRAGVISSAVLAVSACSYGARCLQIDGPDSLFTGVLLDNTLDIRSITRHLPLSIDIQTETLYLLGWIPLHDGSKCWSNAWLEIM